MRRTLYLFIIGLIIVGGFHQDAQAYERTGTSAMKFLSIGTGASVIGRGEAIVASINDVNSIFWNPAGLASMDAVGVGISHVKWIADINYSAVGIAFPLPGWGTIAFNVNYLGSPEMQVTTVGQIKKGVFLPDGSINLGIAPGTFRWTDFALGIAFARYLTDKFSVGLHMQYIQEDVLGYESYRTFSADVGVQYDTGFKGVRLGGSIQNFGPDIKYYARSYPMPLIFRLGMSFDLLRSSDAFLMDSEIHSFTLNVDGLHPTDYREKVYLGAQYGFQDMVFLRGGYKVNNDQEKLTAGAGLKLNAGVMKWTVDFAYGDFGEYFDAPLRFSAGVEF